MRSLSSRPVTAEILSKVKHTALYGTRLPFTGLGIKRRSEKRGERRGERREERGERREEREERREERGERRGE